MKWSWIATFKLNHFASLFSINEDSGIDTYDFAYTDAHEILGRTLFDSSLLDTLYILQIYCIEGFKYSV